MKISNDYPVLQKTNSLFLVAGKQSAVIYRLNRGEILERETIRIEKPEYTDREGHFEHIGPGGKLHGSGSVYEPKNEYIQKKFLTKLAKEITGIRRPYDEIYLFAPQHTINAVEEALPNSVTKHIKKEFAGNFTKEHPTSLLKKVKNLRLFNEKIEARQRATGDAAKLLKRGASLDKKPYSPKAIG